MKLRDTFAAQEDSLAVASGRHASWVEAIAGYHARRRRELRQGLGDAASFDADKARLRIKVLPELMRTLGGEYGELPPDAEKAIQRTPGMTREDHQIALGYILTPLGWKEKQLPALEKRREEALTEWEDEKDGDQNLALVFEIDRLIQFLQAVEADAHRAAGMKRVVGTPAIPGSSLRSAM